MIELERLWMEEEFRKKKEMAASMGESGKVPKAALFKQNHDLFFGVNPNFGTKNKEVYCRAMTIVAMAVTNEQWRSLFDGGSNDQSLAAKVSQPPAHVRELFSAIQTQTLAVASELEVQWMERDPNKADRSRPGLDSLGKRMKDIIDNQREGHAEGRH